MLMLSTGLGGGDKRRGNDEGKGRDWSGDTDLADDLALHEDAHGHVQAEELPLHLELHVVLRCLPLRFR